MDQTYHSAAEIRSRAWRQGIKTLKVASGMNIN